MIHAHAEPSAASLLVATVKAVTEAGELVRAEFHRPGGPRGSGATAPIDTEVEAFLKLSLRALHPCGFLGEHTAPVRTPGDIWVVDPQDGTADFLAGRRGSAVSVALLRRGRPILGVVFAPTAPDDRGDLISWAEGVPLMRNGKAVPRVTTSDPPVVAMNARAPDYARHNHLTLQGIRVRAVPGPAYRLALAAVGEVDAAINLTQGTAPWNIAGGHALLVGAGGVLVDLAGRSIEYKEHGFAGCVGGTADVVAKLLSMRPCPGPRERRDGATSLRGGLPMPAFSPAHRAACSDNWRATRWARRSSSALPTKSPAVIHGASRISAMAEPGASSPDSLPTTARWRWRWRAHWSPGAGSTLPPSGNPMCVGPGPDPSISAAPHATGSLRSRRVGRPTRKARPTGR